MPLYHKPHSAVALDGFKNFCWHRGKHDEGNDMQTSESYVN